MGVYRLGYIIYNLKCAECCANALCLLEAHWLVPSSVHFLAKRCTEEGTNQWASRRVCAFAQHIVYRVHNDRYRLRVRTGMTKCLGPHYDRGAGRVVVILNVLCKVNRAFIPQHFYYYYCVCADLRGYRLRAYG